MTKLDRLKREIEALPPQDIWALGEWLDALCERLWDGEPDAGPPAMDALAAQALEEHRAGKTTPLVRNS
jgi:hypothetical protein